MISFLLKEAMAVELKSKEDSCGWLNFDHFDIEITLRNLVLKLKDNT